MRAVIDTGVLVSALICCHGTTGDVLQALRDGRFTCVYSTVMLVEIVDELGSTFFRHKYHIQPDDTAALINLLRLRGHMVTPRRAITICRDPKDKIFLEAAAAGEVDYIVSVDADLLILSPFENIPILRPAEFLMLL